jgi:hypothetical protein
VVVSKMELYELLRKADSADVDFLREGVRTLAQALMEVESRPRSALSMASAPLSGRPTATATGPGTGTPGSARWSLRSLGCARAATSRRSWSRAGGPSGRWPQW